MRFYIAVSACLIGLVAAIPRATVLPRTTLQFVDAPMTDAELKNAGIKLDDGASSNSLEDMAGSNAIPAGGLFAWKLQCNYQVVNQLNILWSDFKTPYEAWCRVIVNESAALKKGFTRSLKYALPNNSTILSK